MKKPMKAWIGLALLEIAVGAALLVTIFLSLGSQVDRKRTAAELAEAAAGALANGEQSRDAEAWELRKYYGISEEDVEEFVLHLPATNMDAAELCVVKCGSDEAARTVAEAMKKRREEQISLFENYGVEQMKLLNAARAFSIGPYAVLIIDENADDAAAAVLRLTGGRAE